MTEFEFDYDKIQYGTVLRVTNFEGLDDEETYKVLLVNDVAGGSGYPCVIVDCDSFEVLASFMDISDFLNNVTVLEIVKEKL